MFLEAPLIGAVVGALLIVAVVVPALRALSRKRSSRNPDLHGVRPMLLPADPAVTPTPALCRAWRISYLVLQNAHDPVQRSQIAEMRGQYLDELARRDVAGFHRWLADGARAGSDPAPYLTAVTDGLGPEDDAAARR
jgi:hypothetical protein